MNLIISSLCFQFILINIALAQYNIGPSIKIPRHASNAPTITKGQLLAYLLSNTNQALPDRIDTIASALQLMPPRKNQRVQLAEVLKQTALQNLMVAASVCETNNVPFATLRRQYMVANKPVASPVEYAAPLRRQYVVANSALNEFASPVVQRKQYVVANGGHEPVGRDLAALLPADLLSWISDNVPNANVRYQYV